MYCPFIPDDLSVFKEPVSFEESSGSIWRKLPGTLGKMSMTLFHEKNSELSKLKKRANRLMSVFNRMYCEYADWFKRRENSFLNAVKSVQTTIPTLVPDGISTMQDYLQIVKMGRHIHSLNRTVGGHDLLGQVEKFWNQFLEAKDQLENILLKDIDVFNESVQCLRENNAHEKMDQLRLKLSSQCSESYDFSQIHDERNHLFTYRLMVCDQGFLGLIGYLPYLLNYAIKICFLVNQIYIEKAWVNWVVCPDSSFILIDVNHNSNAIVLGFHFHIQVFVVLFCLFICGIYWTNHFLCVLE